MKTTLYKTFLYVCTGLGTLVLPTGCSEDKMDEINQDINDALIVEYYNRII